MCYSPYVFVYIVVCMISPDKAIVATLRRQSRSGEKGCGDGQPSSV